MGVGVCENCGEYKELKSQKVGLCNACYGYQRRNGKPRPLGVNLRARVVYSHCRNCGRERHCRNRMGAREGGDGMCAACYSYQKRNGKPRPKGGALMSRVGLCSNCHRAKIVAKGLCVACWSYKNKHGKPRPKRYFRESCSNCGAPFDTYTRTGMCRTCHQYRWRVGVNRPEHLWRSPHGWCECGTRRRPVKATHTVIVRIHQHDEEIPMCDECYAEHMRHVRWYGDAHIERQKGHGND